MKTILVLLSAVGTMASLLFECMAFLAWNPTGMVVYGVTLILLASLLKGSLYWAERG